MEALWRNDEEKKRKSRGRKCRDVDTVIGCQNDDALTPCEERPLWSPFCNFTSSSPNLGRECLCQKWERMIYSLTGLCFLIAKLDEDVDGVKIEETRST